MLGLALQHVGVSPPGFPPAGRPGKPVPEGRAEERGLRVPAERRAGGGRAVPGAGERLPGIRYSPRALLSPLPLSSGVLLLAAPGIPE